MKVPPPRLLKLDREALARDVRALPSLPTVVQELMMLVQNNEVQLDTITNTLSLDQALSVKVLHLANSPFYGLSGRVRSIRDAINILGMRQLSSLVIAAALTSGAVPSRLSTTGLMLRSYLVANSQSRWS